MSLSDKITDNGLVRDSDLVSLIEPLAQLSPAETAQWLIQLSREELLVRFGNHSLKH